MGSLDTTTREGIKFIYGSATSAVLPDARAGGTAMRDLSRCAGAPGTRSRRAQRAAGAGRVRKREAPCRRDRTRPARRALLAQRGPHDLTAKRCCGHPTFGGILDDDGDHHGGILGWRKADEPAMGGLARAVL